MSCTYLTHHKPDSMFIIMINIIQSRHSLAVTQAVTDAADSQCWVLPFEHGSSSAKLSDSHKDRQLCSRVAILSASAHKQTHLSADLTAMSTARTATTLQRFDLRKPATSLLQGKPQGKPQAKHSNAQICVLLCLPSTADVILTICCLWIFSFLLALACSLTL
jgi:hypothetical protein